MSLDTSYGLFHEHHGSTPISSGDYVYFVAHDNGRYMKRFDGIHRHQCLTLDNPFAESFAKFQIEIHQDNNITLKADNQKYLKRYDGIKGKQVITMDNSSPDQFSYFKITYHGKNLVTLQADNGDYLKRYSEIDGHDVVSMQKKKDDFSLWHIVKHDSYN